MDPNLFDRINTLQNYQNQKTNQATQAELAALRQQLAEEANKPKCPHCGGPSEQGFNRCKNCGMEVIWWGHFVGKPGTMTHLIMAMEQYEIAKKEEQRQQKQLDQLKKQQWKEWFFKTLPISFSVVCVVATVLMFLLFILVVCANVTGVVPDSS